MFGDQVANKKTFKTNFCLFLIPVFIIFKKKFHTCIVCRDKKALITSFCVNQYETELYLFVHFVYHLFSGVARTFPLAHPEDYTEEENEENLRKNERQ